MASKPLRLDVAALLREQARGFRDLAEINERAAAAMGDERREILTTAVERLRDVLAVSRLSALETIDGVVNDELADEPWQVRVGTAMSMLAHGFGLDVSHYRWASAGRGQTRLVFVVRVRKEDLA